MLQETFSFTGSNGVELPGTLWLPEGKPLALLQLTHGMTEHTGRYADFAQELTNHGIAVAGFDLRGHGQNPGNPDVASFGEKGWDATIEDMKCFYDLLDARFPEIPHFLQGFSLGSFLLREYLGRYFDGPAGAIILGTGYQPPAILSVLQWIIQKEWNKAGFDNTTDLVKKLSFETYNQKFRPNRTDADWLCADEAQLDTYRKDPLVRRNISGGLFWELLGSMKRTGSPFTYDHGDTEIPVLLLSGEDDPVGDQGKGVRKVYQQMRKSGIEDVTLHLLPDARHDVLHEVSSGAAAQATEIIRAWILQQISK